MTRLGITLGLWMKERMMVDLSIRGLPCMEPWRAAESTIIKFRRSRESGSAGRSGANCSLRDAGAALGFPGLILDPLGPVVDVDLFESAELPRHWARLDEFEGGGYQRVVTTVWTEAGERSAWIYVLAQQP